MLIWLNRTHEPARRSLLPCRIASQVRQQPACSKTHNRHCVVYAQIPNVTLGTINCERIAFAIDRRQGSQEDSRPRLEESNSAAFPRRSKSVLAASLTAMKAARWALTSQLAAGRLSAFGVSSVT